MITPVSKMRLCPFLQIWNLTFCHLLPGDRISLNAQQVQIDSRRFSQSNQHAMADAFSASRSARDRERRGSNSGKTRPEGRGLRRSTGRTTFLLYLTNSRFKHDYGRKWATLIADSIVTDTGARR